MKKISGKKLFYIHSNIFSWFVMFASTQPILRGETNITYVNVIIAIIGVSVRMYTTNKVNKFI